MIINTVSPFDILASSYDEDFTGSNTGRLQRGRVWSYLQKVLDAKQGPLKILEINCGTGEDALQLSRSGDTVIATDASENMIQKAKEKGSAYPGDPGVEFIVCSFDELLTSFKEVKFDLIFSNFGGLNCIDTTALKKLNKDLFSLLKPGGDLFFVIMSNCCLWEIFYYSLKGKPNKTFRRFKKSISFNIKGAVMPVYYYSPAVVKKIFTSSFSFIQKHPVGLFIPPSYLEKNFRSRPQSLNRLYNLEKRLAYSFLSLFADHYCINFKKPVT